MDSMMERRRLMESRERLALAAEQAVEALRAMIAVMVFAGIVGTAAFLWWATSL